MFVRRLLIIALAAAIGGTSGLAQTASGHQVSVKIIAINDFHGYIAPSETLRVLDPADITTHSPITPGPRDRIVREN